MGANIEVHADLIDNRIAELETLCQHILELSDALENVDDDFSEGEYYTRYIEGVIAIKETMEVSERIIRGYINFVRYAKDNYSTLSDDLAEAISML